ncbi:hypothetical protein D3C87_1952970 [compost metagenome]
MGGGGDARRNGFLDAVGAGFEIGHGLGDRGIDRGVERGETLGGDISAGSDGFGEAAETLVDEVDH